jgi:hypothetical protein
MEPIHILDDSLEVEIFFDKGDCGYTDNICLKITESCEEEEKVFRHDENNLYLTAEQATALVTALTKAVKESQQEK